MDSLNSIDYAVIIFYLGLLVAMGFYLKNKASQSLEDYFLGGRKLPWWALGITGMAQFLDITGTMIIVSFLYMLGPRGLFIEFRGGAVLILTVMLLWTGKWHRRSGCITNAEWMVYRFGDGFGGQFARTVQAVAGIVSTLGMLAYLVKGVGLFLSMFFPFTPLQCSLIMIGVATLYTMISGFYGVVYTDLFQSLIILGAVIGITAMAILKLGSSEQLVALSQEVTGNSQWMSSRLSWVTEMPKGYEMYRHLMIFAMFYLMRNIFFGMGSGGEPKYFGARNDRECGTLTFLWTWLMMFRWPMMMAFAILGLLLVRDIFPDQSVLTQAAELVKSHFPDVEQSRWADITAGITLNPENHSPQLVEGLKAILQDNWQNKMHLLSYEGTVNSERILPAVILFNIPAGCRGLILIALLAASMSTFDFIVNMTAGFFTRDVYQRYIRPKATNKELIYATWAFIFALVGTGFLFGYSVKSINDIWDWFIMALGGGLVVGMTLRFYWWRFNGAAFAIGTAVGMIGAVVMRVVTVNLADDAQLMFAGIDLVWFLVDPRGQFLLTMAIGFAGSIFGTYVTKPTDRKVLEHFYQTTRPFGWWGPLEDCLPADVRQRMKKEHFYDVLSLPFAIVWQVTIFLLPMQLIIRSWNAFFVTLVIFAVSLVGLYFFWYKKLPATNYEEEYEKTA
ncbi:MAG: sodium:solute symporter [Phycisphaerae bacterium SG8_4]|nr:MAG: sodium:solute symporter [Phycisphaerae bacterium SG8_4]